MNYIFGITSAKEVFVKEVERFVKEHGDNFVGKTTREDGPQNTKWYKTIDFKLTLINVKVCNHNAKEVEVVEEFIAGLEYYWEQFILEFMWNKVHGEM